MQETRVFCVQRPINIMINMIYAPANIFQAREPKGSAAARPPPPPSSVLVVKTPGCTHGFNINPVLCQCITKRERSRDHMCCCDQWITGQRSTTLTGQRKLITHWQTTTFHWLSKNKQQSFFKAGIPNSKRVRVGSLFLSEHYCKINISGFFNVDGTEHDNVKSWFGSRKLGRAFFTSAK